MDAKLIKQVDSLVRNMKPMPALAFAGVIIPIILLFAAPLGLVYAGQRLRLLKTLDSVAPPDTPTVAEQVAYIRDHNWRLYVPMIVAVVYVAVIGGLFACVLLSGRI